jgi:periplasmic divalent cation tolerance protein
VSSTAGSQIVIVLTTLGADADASAFGRTLIEEQLAACVSALPSMTSVYRWKGSIEEAREQQVVIKTSSSRLDALQTRFRTLHPYEVPEFLVIRPDDVSALYGKWLEESVARST